MNVIDETDEYQNNEKYDRQNNGKNDCYENNGY